MDYKITIDQFEGPLDLLLHLIKESDIDICDISIVEITNQYLNYINAMESMNLDIASEYIVMAAELIEMKSLVLLPKPEKIEDDYEEDPRQQLITKLLDYKQYKEMTSVFKNLEELTLISEIVSITLINKLVNLKYLQLSYSNLLDTDDIVLNNIEEIYLDNTNLTNLDFLKNMPKLKRVSIDERQHEKNLELIKNLEKNHILVLNENIVWFTE